MHKNRLNIFFLFTTLIGFSTCINAQQLNAELKDLIKKGLEKSHQINIHHLDQEQTKVDQKLAKAIFLPKITFGASYTRLDDDITFDVIVNPLPDFVVTSPQILCLNNTPLTLQVENPLMSLYLVILRETSEWYNKRL